MHSFLILGGAHPQIDSIIVALVAFVASLAIVGTFVQAAIGTLRAGALIGNGALNVWYAFRAAILGAVAVDGLSYELGRRYESQFSAWTMFKRHRVAVEKGEVFIQRHGAKVSYSHGLPLQSFLTSWRNDGGEV